MSFTTAICNHPTGRGVGGPVWVRKIRKGVFLFCTKGRKGESFCSRRGFRPPPP